MVCAIRVDDRGAQVHVEVHRWQANTPVHEQAHRVALDRKARAHERGGHVLHTLAAVADGERYLEERRLDVHGLARAGEGREALLHRQQRQILDAADHLRELRLATLLQQRMLGDRLGDTAERLDDSGRSPVEILGRVHGERDDQPGRHAVHDLGKGS